MYAHLKTLVAQMVKNLPAMQETRVGKIPWRREWLPTPVFLPEESHGQRSLVGCTPEGWKELDMLEATEYTKAVLRGKLIAKQS